jgi:thiazole tautomerase (transcriptional regulator TenI)
VASGVPRLHLVTDDRVLASKGFLGRAREALDAGGPAIALHVRGPATPVRALLELCSTLLPQVRRAGALLVVNDRVDLAASIGADGVQLAGHSLPCASVYALRTEGALPPWLRLGVSVHGPRAAASVPDADWLVVGTLYPTPSHPGRKGEGPVLLERVGGVARVPMLGIGGVTPDRVADVVAAGGHGVAVLGGAWRTAGGSTGGAVRDYLEALAEAGIADRKERS